MRIIKVDATNSTNSFLRDLFRQNPAMDNCCLVAKEQTLGRGQKGTVWQADAGKNLTFSLLFTGLELEVNTQFKLSAVVSLGVLEALKNQGVPNLKIKWPNDILAGNFKIGGILIENFLKGDRVHATIAGIGLNINQEKFDHLPKAASLKMLMGKKIDLDLLLEEVIHSVEKKMRLLKELPMEEVLRRYHEKLFAMGKVSTFQLPNGTRFSGIVQGIDEQGKLQVLTDDDILKKFEVKEVKLLY